jgi:hypothetical protein
MRSNVRVVAVDPTHTGFGYVVFEGPNFLVDWGVRRVTGEKNRSCAKAVSQLIDWYRPEVLLLEDSKKCRRGQRVQQLILTLAAHAKQTRLKVRLISRSMVRRQFGRMGPSTNFAIAKALAERFPELAERLPPERKPWMSEDRRMAIFDAAAFAMVCLQSTNEDQMPARLRRATATAR